MLAPIWASFRLYGLAPTYQALVTLHAPAAQVAGHLGDAPGEVEPVDDRTCRLRSHVDTLEWLAFRLVLLDCEFEVHEPPELAEYLRALGARVIRAAGGAAAPPRGHSPLHDVGEMERGPG